MNNTGHICFTFPWTYPGHAAWVADPSCRGSFGIVSLCLSTTIVCVWSSVHRDIPLKRLSAFRSLLRDAPLVLVALFAPEVLFYFALNQYLNARELVKIAAASDSFKVPLVEKHPRTPTIRMLLDLLKLRGGSPQEREVEIGFERVAPPVNSNRRQHPFTLTHGFYAIMGGFAILVPDEDGTVSYRRAKLTYYGVKHLMNNYPDVIPDLSITSITDRSKSSSLGKAVLTIQMAWFWINCDSRLAEGLPLSLLEVSTLAHGLFTLSSYAMWWSKPLSVDEPTWISIDAEILAQMESLNPSEDGRRDTKMVTFDTAPQLSSILLTDQLTPVMDTIVTTVIPLVYASLHYIGWDAQFATTAEQMVWRIAVVIVMSYGAVNFICRCLLLDPLLTSSAKYGRIAGRTYDALIFFIIPFVYMLSSMCLLALSIRQVWYLPIEGYVVASWSYYFSHWL